MTSSPAFSLDQFVAEIGALEIELRVIQLQIEMIEIELRLQVLRGENSHHKELLNGSWRFHSSQGSVREPSVGVMWRNLQDFSNVAHLGLLEAMPARQDRRTGHKDFGSHWHSDPGSQVQRKQSNSVQTKPQSSSMHSQLRKKERDNLSELQRRAHLKLHVVAEGRIACTEKSAQLEHDSSIRIVTQIETDVSPRQTPNCITASIIVELLTELTVNARKAVHVFTRSLQQQLQNAHLASVGEYMQKLKPGVALQRGANIKYFLEAALSTILLSDFNSLALGLSGRSRRPSWQRVSDAKEESKERSNGPAMSNSFHIRDFVKSRLLEFGGVFSNASARSTQDELETMQRIIGDDVQRKIEFVRMCKAVWSIIQFARIVGHICTFWVDKGDEIDERLMKLVEPLRSHGLSDSAVVELCVFPGFRMCGSVVHCFVCQGTC